MSGLSGLPIPIRSGAIARPNEVTWGRMLRYKYDGVGVSVQKQNGVTHHAAHRRVFNA